MYFALVKDVTENSSSTFIELTANSETRIDAALLGNITTNRYLKVLNINVHLKGAYTLELV